MDLPMREPSGAAVPVGNRIKFGTRAVRQKITERVNRLKLAWRLMLVGLLVCLAAIIWLSQTSTLVSIGYEIDNIEKQELVLNKQAESINSQISQLTSYRAVQQAAKDKLGMVESTKSIYVKVGGANEPVQNTGSTNPRLYQVNEWWRQLTEMLPYPWHDSAPARPR